MNFRDGNMAVGAQTSGDIDHGHRHIQMERELEAAEGDPLRERLEVIDRLDGFHLDHGHHITPPVLRHEDDIRIDRAYTRSNRAVLLGPGVDADVETTAKLRL